MISPIDGSTRETHPSIRIGAEYPVLSISYTSRGLTLQILTDDGPSYWRAEMFETTSSSIPSSWVTQLSDGNLDIGPEKFLRPGFWESYFDDDPGAIRTFTAELENLRP
ncbi:hypothetical protein ACFWF7_14785 [Nocardia sp. NPDC060256]|uniref:hypothetical protein n=1 Tax=unclassified Nocardia TaxID=2637762 RepID=UPI00365B1430